MVRKGAGRLSRTRRAPKILLDNSQCIVGSQALSQHLFASGRPINIDMIDFRGVSQAKV